MQLPINGFKTRQRVFCPKQGHKIEVVALNRVCILGFFCPEQGQGLKPSAAHLFPNIGGVPPPQRKQPYFPIICVCQYISHYSTVCNVHVFTPCSKKYVMILKISLFWKHAVTLETTHFMLMTKVNCLKSLVNNTLDHFFFHTTNKKETIKSNKLNFQAPARIQEKDLIPWTLLECSLILTHVFFEKSVPGK